MTWAQRLKRVFNIDIETCIQCGGAVKIIACIEDSGVIKKILDHLTAMTSADTPMRPRVGHRRSGLCRPELQSATLENEIARGNASFARNVWRCRCAL